MQQPIKMAALVHSAEVAELVRREAEAAGHDLRPVVTSLEAAGDNAARLLEEGHEALLCHGHCRHVVFRRFSKQTLFIERSDMDLLAALLQAREISREVMLTAHADEPWDIALMEQLLDMRIHLVSYAGEEDMRQGFFRLFRQGIQVAVGGGVTGRLMEELGGRNFLDLPQPRNIRAALERAVNLARHNRLEAARLTDLKDVLQHVREGVICIGADEKLIYCNDTARKLLQAPSVEMLRARFDSLGLTRAVRDGKSSLDNLLRVGAERLLVNAFPVARHTDAPGAVALIQDVAYLQKLNRTIGNKLHPRGFEARYSAADIKGHSRVLRNMLQKIRRYAATDAAVLIEGETGTGKELAAQALHQASRRKGLPFVAVNCGALPESLLESELFGYEEGAFTGARRGGKPGLFEMANQGTLFLDEIGEISQAVQLRLLRVLEAKEVFRVGGDGVIPVDVRVISASHRPLGELVREGRFRRDLFYRLAGLYVRVPPLRERKEDIPLLLEGLLKAYGRGSEAVSPGMLERLMLETWPGNVRELFAVTSRYLVLLGDAAADDALFGELLEEQRACLYAGAGDPQTQPEKGVRSGGGPGAEETDGNQEAIGPLRARLEACRVRAVREALRRHGGRRDKAARELGVSASTFQRLMAAAGLP